jgi:hypothetical protein
MKLFPNLKLIDSNKAEVPEVLCSAHISQLFLVFNK